MADSPIYRKRAKNILRGELKRKGVSYRQLADALGRLGVSETDRNIANKISRGTFTAAFFLQCLEAADVKVLRLDDE